MQVVKFLAAAALAAGLSLPAIGADHATKDEAMAIVKKAVAFLQQNGPDKAYAEFDHKGGQFTDRDLYVVVYGLDGKYFVKERTELARKQVEFWQDYKFVNPVTKKVEPKQMYCQRVGETAVCAGVYRS